MRNFFLFLTLVTVCFATGWMACYKSLSDKTVALSEELNSVKHDARVYKELLEEERSKAVENAAFIDRQVSTISRLMEKLQLAVVMPHGQAFTLDDGTKVIVNRYQNMGNEFFVEYEGLGSTVEVSVDNEHILKALAYLAAQAVKGDL